MTPTTFADLVHPGLAFSPSVPSQRVILELIDNPWFQRLRDISQTANTRLVYMFSEHSRFGHSLGVAYLADSIVEKLSARRPDEVGPLRTAVAVAALLHDVGHLAPGSHTAFRSWFPHLPDSHEEIGTRIILEDPGVAGILSRAEPGLAESVAKILAEDPSLPPWSWEVISGGGWNVDRGNWCIVDSILAGVSYGEYNIPALTESITITDSGHLALRENRLDAMMHFAVSRHAMYRQIYQHRVLLSADMINVAIVRRARDLLEEEGPSGLPFCDETMASALGASSPGELSLDTIFRMREPWWRYHLMRWADGGDPILADLSARLLHRRLFKTVRLREGETVEELASRAFEVLRRSGFDPRYYLHAVSTADTHSGDQRHSMLVLRDDGTVLPLRDADPLFNAMALTERRTWLVLPREAKELLGRSR